jgi:uncharacterized membrane protein YgdD (TMEM256/DUF423 family)
MTIRGWLATAAVGGFVSVCAGAFAAHLTPGDSHQAELLRTGALYGMVHAAALTAVSAIAQRQEPAKLALSVAAAGFAAGIVLFSFSLFALALTGVGGFGLVTPFGGVALLIGWAGLGAAAFRRF